MKEQIEQQNQGVKDVAQCANFHGNGKSVSISER